MRKTLCIIGLLGTLGLFTACGDNAAVSRSNEAGRIELPNAQSASGRVLAADRDNMNLELPSEFVAYLKGIQGEEVCVDMAEWVEVPGSRAEELGISEDDAPGGFSVYNPDTVERTIPLSADCKIIVQIWENNNEEKEVSADEFASILKARGAQGMERPYRFAAKDGKIVSIQEQYIP